MKNKLVNVGLPILILVIIISLVAIAIFKYDNQQKDDAVAVTVPVELKATANVADANIGMIVTIGNEAAEGSEWNQAAAGAQVAKERFSRGGAKINLLTENDKGTADGAKEAIAHLADQKVSGIIVASSGPHIQAAIDEAKARNIPVILPYAQASGDSWSLQADHQALQHLIEQSVSETNQVIRIDQTGFVSLDVSAEEHKSIAPDTDFKQLAQDLVKATEDTNKTYAIVLNADSYTQGKFLRAIQGLPVHAKIFLSDEATSPAFEQTMMKDQQTTIIDAQTPGVAFGDSIALQSDGQGRSMSSYLQAVKILSDSSQGTITFEDQNFSDVATSADSRAHDAFVAIVRAAEKAESTDPEKVQQALNTLSLTPADGITANHFDFSQQQVTHGQESMLSATVGNLQLRSFDKNLNPTILWVPQA